MNKQPKKHIRRKTVKGKEYKYSYNVLTFILSDEMQASLQQFADSAKMNKAEAIRHILAWFLDEIPFHIETMKENNNGQ